MKQSRSQRCRETVWHGLDDDTAALEVDVDPVALTPHGEAWAVISGRITYTVDPLTRRRVSRQMWRRRAAHIGKPEHWATVHAAHRCGQPIPDDWRLPPPPPVRRVAHDEEPLF
jgi:hypothetical protein